MDREAVRTGQAKPRAVVSHSLRTPLRLLLLATICVAAGSGCVERRMTIRSEPPGALVEVDNYPIGFAPASTGFTYYAPRKVRLTLDNHETVTVVEEVPAPWWDNLFTEFFTEHLIPWTIRDEREITIPMPPRQAVSTGQLLGRAQQLRDEGHSNADPSADPAAPPAGGSPPF